MSSRKRQANSTTINILAGAAVVLATYLLFAVSFFSTIYNRGVYDSSYAASGVYDELGVDGVRRLTDNLINYLTIENTEQQIIGGGLFFQNELEHLQDVKMLIIAAKWLAIASALALGWLVYRLRKEPKLYKSMVLAGIVAIAASGTVALLALNFTSFFEAFHKIAFPQGNYTFPSNYLLIKLFPESFFRAFATNMLVQTALLGAMLSSATALAQRYTCRDKMRNS